MLTVCFDNQTNRGYRWFCRIRGVWFESRGHYKTVEKARIAGERWLDRQKKD